MSTDDSQRDQPDRFVPGADPATASHWENFVREFVLKPAVLFQGRIFMLQTRRIIREIVTTVIEDNIRSVSAVAPTSLFPEHRRRHIAQLVAEGELILYTVPPRTHHLLSTVLLQAIRGVSPEWRDYLLRDPAANAAWRRWLQWAGEPENLAERFHLDVLKFMEGSPHADPRYWAAHVAAIANAFGVTEVRAAACDVLARLPPLDDTRSGS